MAAAAAGLRGTTPRARGRARAGLRGTPAAPLRPPPRREARGGGTDGRLIVKRRSDRRSPGRNPGPQVRSKCR